MLRKFELGGRPRRRMLLFFCLYFRRIRNDFFNFSAPESELSSTRSGILVHMLGGDLSETCMRI